MPLPSTLAEAVAHILSEMSVDEKRRVRETKREDLIQFHFGWGMGIRNALGLGSGNYALLRSACGGELCHPDDASMRIIEAVWVELQKDP